MPLTWIHVADPVESLLASRLVLMFNANFDCQMLAQTSMAFGRLGSPVRRQVRHGLLIAGGSAKPFRPPAGSAGRRIPRSHLKSRITAHAARPATHAAGMASKTLLQAFLAAPELIRGRFSTLHPLPFWASYKPAPFYRDSQH